MARRRTTEPAQPSRGTEDAFRLAFESARDAIFWADAKKAVILHCNPAAERLLQRRRAALIGQPITFMHPPEGEREYRRRFRERVRSGDTSLAEAEVLRKNGERRTVLISASRSTLDGTPIVQGIFHDVTELRATERALRESEANFRALVENATEAIMIQTKDGIAYANRTAVDLSGYGFKDLARIAVDDVMAPLERDRVRDFTHRRLAGDLAPVQYESAILTKQGTEVPVEITAAATTWHGEPATIGMLRDISARRMAERALLERDQMLQRAQDIARVGSWYRRLDEDKAWMSDGMLSIWGLSREEVEGSEEGAAMKAFFARIHPDDRDRVWKHTQDLLVKGIETSHEYRVRLADGTERFVSSIGRPDHDEEGNIVGAVGAVLDITDRRRMEQDLMEVSRREQERIGQDLHDSLGQELLGISFLAKALERKVARQVPELGEDAHRLAQLANQSLRQARRLAHGLVPLEMDREALAAELKNLAAHVRDSYGIACTCRVWDAGFVHDNKVATHLYHVAREAVSNAVRHGKPTRLRIDLRSGVDGKLTIRDNGKWNRGKSDGGGMGLRIMKHRAGLIGGQCRVEHCKAKGTTVVCTFRNSRPSNDGKP